jgi:hypothetical protein
VRNLAEAKVAGVALTFSLTYQTSAETLERLPAIAERSAQSGPRRAKLCAAIPTAFARVRLIANWSMTTVTISPTRCAPQGGLHRRLARAFGREKNGLSPILNQTTFTPPRRDAGHAMGRRRSTK